MTIVPPATALFDGTIPASGSADVNFSLTYDRTYYVEVNGTLHTATAALWTQEDINLTAVPVGGGDKPEEPPIDPGDPDNPPVNPGDPDDPPAQLGAFVGIVAGDVTIVGSDRGETSILEGPAGATVTVYNNDPTRVSASYVRGLNLIASRTEKGVVTYYHYNAHGDVVQLTDSTGALVKNYEYDAFGVEENADEDDANLFRYCGEQFDAETGDYYLRARYYTPGTGRFTQADTHWNPGNMVYGDNPRKWNEYQSWLDEADRDDPLGLHTYTYKPDFTAVAQAGNLYGYGLNNPLQYKDTDGRFAISLSALFGICAAAIVSVHTWNFFANTAEGKQIISEISDQLSVSWNRVVNDIRTQISQAGQKEKKRKVPSQLDKGDGKMKTPDTDPNEWK